MTRERQKKSKTEHVFYKNMKLCWISLNTEILQRGLQEMEPKKITERVNNLDVSLYEMIPSLTLKSEQRALLAVQRATVGRRDRYAYLEIGSHLGGTIQPHLVDSRCKRIYSVDPRPHSQPDDRSPGFIDTYEGNSTERMLELLQMIDAEESKKIKCFEVDASKIDLRRINVNPDIAFIDGEHTKSAVLSDFLFCDRVVRPDGTIVFHDFGIVYPAIFDICRQLRRKRREYTAVKLENEVFAIFFDPRIVFSDPYLSELHNRNKSFVVRFRIKRWIEKLLPKPIWNTLVSIRHFLTCAGGKLLRK